MKIVFLSDDFPPISYGGAGISTSELALGMKKAGQEVYVISTCSRQEDEGEADYQGLKVFRIKSDYEERWRAYRSLYNRPVVKQVKELLEKIKPDVVHANNIHYHLSYYSLKIAKKYAKTVVLTFRDTMPLTYGKLETKKYLDNFNAHITWLDNLKQAKKRWNPLRNILIRRYLGYTDKLFAVSNSLKKALEQNGIKNIEVMQTGMDLTDYQVVTGDKNEKSVFFSGRLSEAKGARVVQDAMKLVSQQVSKAELVTAGTNGKWLNREEMKLAYTSSQVVLVPSVYLDPFPRAVLESMALGKPVVGTCYGGAPEAIVDGVTGYVVNPFHVEEMAEKIIDLLKDPEKANKFGQAGRERIKSEFNLQDKVTKLIKIYEILY